MTIELKPISRDAVPEAMEKVERYRLLKEPWQAQSICEDILRVDPDNQEALVQLLLAMTDQIGDGVSEAETRSLLPRLEGEYQRAYYEGIIYERSARAALRAGHPGSKMIASESLQEAMHCYERAELSRPAGNDDAILRWNTCARTILKDRSLEPRPEERPQEVLGE
jgi:hypothetical protein